MTTEYSEGGLSKKKLMAPLVVIMFCAVAITGAAYAYNSTVSGNGDISAQYFVIDMYEAKEGKATGELCKNPKEDYNLDVYTETDKTSGDSSSWKYVAHVTEKTYNYYTFIQLKTNSKTATETDISYNLSLTLAINYPEGSVGKLGFSPKITITDENENPVEMSGGKYTLTGNAWYKVSFEIKLTDGDDGTFGTYGSSSAVSEDVEKFNTVKLLNVTFTATDSA